MTMEKVNILMAELKERYNAAFGMMYATEVKEIEDGLKALLIRIKVFQALTLGR